MWYTSRSTSAPGGSVRLAADLQVSRIGYGAMQLTGPNAFGAPRDRREAVRVVRTAVELGITHIDTSDFYGPAVANEIVAEALHPYPGNVHVVTKVGRVRDNRGSWIPALSPADITRGVHDNLRRLRLDVLDAVNLRLANGAATRSIEAPFTALARLRDQGLVRHLGLSGTSATQLAQARTIAPVVTVQNLYNIGQRDDDALLDLCAREGIAYTPYFPLGGLHGRAGDAVARVAEHHGASRQQVALAWLLHRSPTLLLIPGTSSVDHLRENVGAAALRLTPEQLAALDRPAL